MLPCCRATVVGTIIISLTFVTQSEIALIDTVAAERWACASLAVRVAYVRISVFVVTVVTLFPCLLDLHMAVVVSRAEGAG